MTFGGWLEADRRLRAYELKARHERKRQADEATWQQWERMVESQEREAAAERLKKD